MGHLLEAVVEALAKAIAHSAPDMVGQAEKTEAGAAGAFLWRSLINVLREHPEIVRIVGEIVSLSLGSIALVVAIHALLKFMFKRRGSVFISYQHDREPLADQLVAALQQLQIRVRKLDFIEGVDHDRLLDGVKHGIRRCDVLVCIPGSGPSFVDSEVAMAFALQRLVILALDESTAAHVPDTAKRGYPVFDLDRVRQDHSHLLAAFCSYMAGDFLATMRVYKAIVLHLTSLHSLILFVGIWLGTLIAASVGSKLLHTDTVHLAVAGHQITVDIFAIATAAPLLITFVVVAVAFFALRFLYRHQLKRAILSRSFSESFIPEVMDAFLARRALLLMLYRGPIVPDHERVGVHGHVSERAVDRHTFMPRRAKD